MGLLDNINKKPVAARKRMMMVFVGIGAVLAIIVWGLTISARITSDKVAESQLGQGNATVFSQLKSLFVGQKSPLDQAVEDYKNNND